MALANLSDQPKLERPSYNVIDLSSDDEGPSPQVMLKQPKHEALPDDQAKHELDDASADDCDSDYSVLNELLENGPEMQLVSGILDTRHFYATNVRC